MGRILKKKDPEKKKAQRQDKVSEGITKSGESDALNKPAPAIKKMPLPAKAKPVAAEPGIVQKSIQFLREVKIELKKVTWPSRKQTMGSTVVVIILVMIISLFLGVVDWGLSSLLRVVLP